MDVDISKLTPPEKVEFFVHEMRDIIDGAKNAIHEEFSRSPNNRVSCFKSIIVQLEIYQSLSQKYADVKNDEVDNKIEKLKIEAARLSDLYPTKDRQPTDEEKKNLFQHLLEIKEMIA